MSRLGALGSTGARSTRHSPAAKSDKYPLVWSGFVFKPACSDQYLTRPLAAARSMHRPPSSFAAAGEWRNSAILIRLSSVFKLAIRRNRCDNYIPKQKETPLTFVRGVCLCWRLPILPGRFQPSIVGTSELNCCVRDGNRCTLTVINTNYSGRFTRALRSE